MFRYMVYTCLILLVITQGFLFKANLEKKQKIETLQTIRIDASGLTNKILDLNTKQINLIGNRIVTKKDLRDTIQAKLKVVNYILIVYINQSSCAPCVANMILDILQFNDKNREGILFVTDFDKVEESSKLSTMLNDKFLVVNKGLSVETFQLSSPSLFVVNKDFLIVNAYNYIQELPQQNVAFLKSVSKLLI